MIYTTTNAALALQYLGFKPNVDFYASEQADGSIEVSWLSAAEQPDQAAVAGAELAAVKAIRIAAINAECRARLVARFGDALEKNSRAVGAYGPADQAALKPGIEAMIDASNAASNAVLAAADIAAVEAVTVTWPAI